MFHDDRMRKPGNVISTDMTGRASIVSEEFCFEMSM